ncbi:MAG: shikimate kinase [Hyphomicrobiaceae bacterium]
MQDDIAAAIGRRVREARTRQGLTRKRLAQISDVSERYLHALENGSANVSIGIIARLATALAVAFDALVTSGSGPGSPLSGDDLAGVVSGMSPVERERAGPVLQQWLEQHRRASRGIALLGLRGAGKTTLGHLLSKRAGLPFVSVTREIERRAGMSLADLFNLGGPDAYRALEIEVVTDLIARPQRLVLETAGGIVGNSSALDMIMGSFKTVWLKASPEEHLSRVASQGDMRPMRGNPRALEHLKVLLAAREPEYRRAECVIDTSGRPIESCLEELTSLAQAAA